MTQFSFFGFTAYLLSIMFHVYLVLAVISFNLENTNRLYHINALLRYLLKLAHHFQLRQESPKECLSLEMFSPKAGSKVLELRSGNIPANHIYNLEVGINNYFGYCPRFTGDFVVRHKVKKAQPVIHFLCIVSRKETRLI